MPHYKLNEMKTQAGMTLIELTVVLLILIGLAGLLLPYVSGFNQKTHDSTNADNLASLNNAVARFMTEKSRAPDNFDSLINGAAATAAASGACTGAAIDTVYCGMLDAGVFTVATLGAGYSPQAASFVQVGLQTVLNNNPDTANKTFQSSINTPVALFAGTKIALVGQARTGANAALAGTVADHLALAFGGRAADYDTTCYDYVALGVNDSNEAIGKTLVNSPVHFATNGDQGPIDNYNHYVTVWKVDKSDVGAAIAGCNTSVEPAKFIGAAMNVPEFQNSHLFGLTAGLGFAYENLDAN